VVTRGIDVSRYQGYLNWEAMPDWVEFAYIGAMDWRSGCVDKMARTNAINASRTRVTGGYYRVDAVKRSPYAEAIDMLSVIDALGLMLPGNLFPAVDIEPTDDIAGSAKVDWAAWTRDFIATYMLHSEVPLMLYGSGSFLRDKVRVDDNLDSRVRFWVGHTAKWATPKGQSPDEFAGKTSFTFNGRTAIHQFDLEEIIPGVTMPGSQVSRFDRNQLMAGVTLDDITVQMAA